MRVTNMIQIKHNTLRIPTGGRLTSWLFTRRGGVEFGATEDKSIQWQGGQIEPGTAGLQVQRPTTRPRSPPTLTQRCLEMTSNLQYFSRKEATVISPVCFHGGPLSWPNWNLEMFVFV